MSHKSAKETISCQDPSNLVIAIYGFDVIQYRIMAKRHFFTALLLAKPLVITRYKSRSAKEAKRKPR